VNFKSDDPLDYRNLDVDITDRFGLVEFDSADRDLSKSFVVVTEPGRYAVETDVTPNNGATYTVKVEECSGTSPGGPRPGPPVDNPKGVMPGTESSKNLPGTGGVPLLGIAVGALAFAGVGFSVLGPSFRRKP